VLSCRPTPEGRQAAEGWLRRPAGHHRDIRSELLVKLALLDRARVDPRDLLRAQRGQLTPTAAALASEMRTVTGYDYALTLWRHESVWRRCGFLTLCCHRCLRGGLVPPVADGDRRRRGR
jgi:hypothetical protein